MSVLKCPKCPYGKDDGITVSRVQPRKWYCHNCGSYFERIADQTPPSVTLKNTIKLQDDELAWTAEEITGTSDRAVAQFYAGINSEDRADFIRRHIDINGDFRVEENSGQTESISKDNPPDGFITYRDTV